MNQKYLFLNNDYNDLRTTINFLAGDLKQQIANESSMIADGDNPLGFDSTLDNVIDTSFLGPKVTLQNLEKYFFNAEIVGIPATTKYVAVGLYILLSSSSYEGTRWHYISSSWTKKRRTN